MNVAPQQEGRLTFTSEAPDFMTAEYVGSILRLDPDTGELYWKVRLNTCRGPGEIAGGIKICGQKGSLQQRWYVQIHGRRYLRYHLVFLLHHGRWPTMSVDHINHDTLDDRPENLREATIAQNNYYKNHQRTRKTPLPTGVFQYNPGRYHARIRHKRKYIGLGTYDTPEQAHAAYLEARKKYFGEFA